MESTPSSCVVALNSAEAAQSLLVDHAADVKKSVGLAKFGRPLLGEGLLTSEADFHKRQRRLLAPAFAPKRHEVWYTDTTSGFYALRIDKRVWPK